MKKLIFFSIFLCIVQFKCFAQNTINSLTFGQNFWFINLKTTQVDINYLDAYLPDIIASGVTSVRIGGIDVNWYFNKLSASNSSLLKTLIKKIRTAKPGMEILVQVGYDPFSNSSISTQASAAALVVQDLNTSSDTDHHVTYWMMNPMESMTRPNHLIGGLVMTLQQRVYLQLL
ncbi:MAG: hypothetical protein HYX39_06270 [Bacteroidetes bacterium]|nr:hypothetical protein [Bacteroidota bacterium]